MFHGAAQGFELFQEGLLVPSSRAVGIVGPVDFDGASIPEVGHPKDFNDIAPLTVLPPLVFDRVVGIKRYHSKKPRTLML